MDLDKTGPEWSILSERTHSIHRVIHTYCLGVVYSHKTLFSYETFDLD